MKRFLGLLVFLPAIAFCVNPNTPKGLESKGYYDFSGGVDTYHSSLSLPDTYVANSLNVLFDANAPISKRQGYTVAFSTKSYQFQTAWTYTDPSNTSWIIIRASDSIVANQLNGAATVLIATVSANNLVGETNANGDAFFVDQSQGVYYWNGTTTINVANSPKGSLITQFHQRVWVAGAAVPNGNQLYGSKQNDGTTWATGLNPADPVQLTVGLQDNFDNLTALYPFIDTLYLGKHYSISALYGFDQTSFQISLITQECGIIDQQSIQTFNHGLDFVSQRGVEFFDGYTCTRISNQVKNLVDPAIQSQGGVNTLSWVQQFQSDWQAGALNGVSAIISPPTLVSSTFSATENSSSSGWGSGTYRNFAVGTSSLSLLTNNSGNIDDPSFEAGSGLNFGATWSLTPTSTFARITAGSLSLTCGSFSAQQGTFYAEHGLGSSPSGNTVTFEEVAVAGGSVINTVTISEPGDCVWRQISVPSAGIGTRVQFRIHNSGFGSDEYLTTIPSYILGGVATFYAASGFDSLGNEYAFFDNIQNGSSTITSGSFTSQTYNTGFSSAVYQVQSGWTTNTSIPTFDIQTAPSPSGPWTEILVGTGTNGVGNQYAKYTSTMTIGSADNALTTINSVSAIATASPGTFKSPIHNTGSMNSWGNFSVVDALNNGNIAFSICSSTNSNMSVPTFCSAQIPNSQITLTTGTFVQWYSTFTVTAATQTPTLNSAAVQWFSGNRSSPMSSTVWDNRYWLSLSTNTSDAFNDATLVLNTKGAWSIFDIHAGGFTQYKGSLYHSDSLASGNVYLDNQGYNDNGNAINAFVKTKDYVQGDVTEDDYFDSIYPSMDSLGNFNVELSYYLDRNYGSPFTLSTINQSEFASNASVKVPFQIIGSLQVFGKSIAYLFQATDLNEPWNLYGFTHFFHSRPTQ